MTSDLASLLIGTGAVTAVTAGAVQVIGRFAAPTRPPADPGARGAWYRDAATDVTAAAAPARDPSACLTRSPASATADDPDASVRIERALDAYGAPGKVTGRAVGPVVVTYMVAPSGGTRASRIAALVADVAVAAGIGPTRARTDPAAGRVIFESPRATRQTVRLGDIYSPDAPGTLPAVIGVTSDGAPSVLDLADAPHVLIAGATGAGKSCMVNAILTSLILRRSADEMKLVLIDPKRTDLAPYGRLPHAVMPVASDTWAATTSLEWCVDAMETRYRRGVRATDPRIVVVIDELADLMLASRRTVEPLIVRLGQKARAAGIHLVVATQRPSVDVVTGLIKANMPTRIALRVASRVDSRVILDRAGAESLLGHGDALVTRGGADPVRVHGAFVTPAEVAAVCDALGT